MLKHQIIDLWVSSGVKPSLSCLLTVMCVFVSVVPPDDPVIEGSPEVLLTAGVPYNMSCVSRGAKPASVIEWQKDGLPIEGAVSTTVRY